MTFLEQKGTSDDITGRSADSSEAGCDLKKGVDILKTFQPLQETISPAWICTSANYALCLTHLYFTQIKSTSSLNYSSPIILLVGGNRDIIGGILEVLKGGEPLKPRIITSFTSSGDIVRLN